ncbi:uncharacterized protein LOC128387318 [Panonychus citri]|uniref:uncharacterized protein LOC128387318 n=1 Tax=Panonychus citri TaxID=50023 RepID=UPI002307DEDC|nr:uncharacterized protein LOC128387318 [Panonychus citri]
MTPIKSRLRKQPKVSYAQNSFSHNCVKCKNKLPSTSCSPPSPQLPSTSCSPPSPQLPSTSFSPPSPQLPSTSFSPPSPQLPSTSFSPPSPQLPSTSFSPPSPQLPSTSCSPPQENDWFRCIGQVDTFESFSVVIERNMGIINQEKLLKLCFSLYKRLRSDDVANDECEGRENIYSISVSAIDEEGKKKKERKTFSYRIKFENGENYLKLAEADEKVETHLKHLNGSYYCNLNGKPCNESGANGRSNSVRDHIRKHIGLKFYCVYCSCYKGVYSFQGLTRHFQKCHWMIGQIEDPEETIII